MAEWKFKIKFVDVRECAVEADTEEEAREKMDSGDWIYEHTVDFYQDDLLSDLKRQDD
jgi:predicted RNase H-like HicB family nuclease